MPKWMDGAPKHFVETVESFRHMQSSWFTKKFYAAINDEDREWLEVIGLNKRQLYWLVHHPEIDDIPKCPVCGGAVHFECGKMHCSQVCAKKDPEVKKKVIASNLERYGTPYPLMSEQIKEKARKTCLERFGVEHSMQSDAVKEKAKATNRRNLGCDWVVQSKEKIELAKATNRRNFGCDWSMQSQTVLEKANETNRMKYGVPRPLQAKQCVDKMQKTMAERYGSVSAFGNSELALKAKRSSRAVNWQRNRDSLLKVKSIELLTPIEEYVNADLFQYRCLVCGCEFDSEGTNYHQVTCPKCLESIGVSRKEKEVAEFVKSLGFDIVENDRSILEGKELDVFVPSRKTAFEYNGSWWHKAERTGTDYHLNKTLECEVKGVRLIHVFSSDWLGKTGICKSLIQGSLGIYDRHVDAEHCRTERLQKEQCLQFFNDNILHYSECGETGIGLILDGDLVAAASFNSIDGATAKIVSYACRCGMNVRNSLRQICQNSGFKRISAEADYSCCDVNAWLDNGFEIVGRTEPQRRWMKNAKSVWDANIETVLGESFDPSLTEAENMSLAGWTQIFDCGNLKMERKTA